MNIASLDAHFASARHGVPRIEHKVHDHLFDLSWISFNVSKFCTEIHSQLVFFSYQPEEHLLKIRNNLIQIQDLRLHDLFATKSKELSRESGRAVARSLNLGQIPPHGIVGPKLF